MPPSESLAPRQPASLETVRNILGSLVARYRQEEVLTAVRQIPAREAKFRPVPGWVTSALSEAYRAKGIQELYSHQSDTAELVRDGKNVVVVTPTASGKTLCYNLPVLNAVVENPDTRALYLFPTKALAQDQLAELQDLGRRLDNSFGVFTYDGDTPCDARKAIRERGHIVLTNPEMLHTGILPHHTKWMRLFENLRYIVLDELHTYRGVFGSHFGECAEAVKASRQILRLRPAIRLLFRHHCEPRRTCVAVDRERRRSRRREWSTCGREAFRLLQPSHGESKFGDSPLLHQRSDSSRERNPRPEAADDCVRKQPIAHRSHSDLFAAGQSFEARPARTNPRLSGRLSAGRTARD